MPVMGPALRRNVQLLQYRRYAEMESNVGNFVLRWLLDDGSKASGATAADSSGNALNGTYQGLTGAAASGFPGGGTGLLTDGTDYATVAHNAALSPQVSGKIWLSSWFKLGALPASSQVLISKGNTNNWEYEVSLTNSPRLT